METVKSCSRCKKERDISEFNNGNKQCNSCISIRHAYYYNNLDKHKQWDKERYERNKDQILEQKREYKQEYKLRTIECSICQCMIRRNHKSEHERTKKHIKNLETQQS